MFQPARSALCPSTYSKPPFAGPEAFLKYISRYVHRVAIDDRRITAYDGKRVTFQYRDRRNGNVVREMTLSAVAFLRRFLLHLLPKGFMKIRGYGLLANGTKDKNLKRCRELLPPMPEATAQPAAVSDLAADETDSRERKCPKCSTRLALSETLDPVRQPVHAANQLRAGPDNRSGTSAPRAP